MGLFASTTIPTQIYVVCIYAPKDVRKVCLCGCLCLFSMMALILRALQHQSTLTCLLWRSSEPGCTFWFFTPLCTFFPTFPICAWDLMFFFCPEETCRSGPAHLTRSLYYICPTPSLVGAKYCSLNNWTCWNWSRFPGHYQDRRMSLPCAPDSSNMKDWSTLANFACMLLET